MWNVLQLTATTTSLQLRFILSNVTSLAFASASGISNTCLKKSMVYEFKGEHEDPSGERTKRLGHIMLFAPCSWWQTPTLPLFFLNEHQDLNEQEGCLFFNRPSQTSVSHRPLTWLFQPDQSRQWHPLTLPAIANVTGRAAFHSQTDTCTHYPHTQTNK